MLFDPGRSKVFWGTVVAVTLISIIGTGSRAAILGLAAFIFVFILVFGFQSLKLLVPLGVVFGIVISITGVPQRFRDFAASPRVETYKTALRAFSSSPKAMTVGLGHGHLYSLLYDNARRSRERRSFAYYMKQNTKYGFSLRNSHSSFLQTLAENGLIGFLLFIVMPIWLFSKLFRPKYSRIRDPAMLRSRVALSGCVSTFVLMMVDVYILANMWLSFIWLTYAIAMAETIEETYEANQFEYGDVSYQDSGTDYFI
jgi:O-antigen ligase